MGAEAKSKRKSNEQEENQVVYHEELPTEILDYTIRAGKYLFQGDVNVLMRMDEYVLRF